MVVHADATLANNATVRSAAKGPWRRWQSNLSFNEGGGKFVEVYVEVRTTSLALVHHSHNLNQIGPNITFF